MQPKIDRSLRARNLGGDGAGEAGRIVRNGRAYIGGICLHDTAGSGTHNDTRYLANPGDGRAVSVDFTVERDGSIYQLNPDLAKFYTFHAGRATKFRTYRNRDVTRVLIGIELVQKNDLSLSPIWPIEQIQAVAELCVFLCQTFGLDKSSIVTHAQVITDGSRSDPRSFPWSAFWFDFNRAANPPAFAMDPASADLGQPQIYTVAAGDTLWKIAKRFNTTVEAIKNLSGMNTPSNDIYPGDVLTVRR